MDFNQDDSFDDESTIWLAGFLRLNPKIDPEIALSVIKSYIADVMVMPELYTKESFLDMVSLILEASKDAAPSKVVH